MRKSALIVLLVMSLPLIIFVWLNRNGTLASIAESSVSQMTGTKVNIQGLNLDIFSLQAELNGLRIGDPNHEFKNMLEADRANMKIEFMPLLAGKLVIEDMRLEKLNFNTARQDSGWLEKPKAAPSTPSAVDGSDSSADQPPTPVSEKTAAKDKKAEASKLEQLKEKMPVIDLSALSKDVDVEALMKPEDMASVKAIRATKEDSQQRLNDINKRLDEQTIEQDIDTLETDYAAFEKTDLKSLKGLKEGAKQLKSMKSSVDSIKKQSSAIVKDTKADLKAVKTSVKDVKSLTQQDIAEVKKLAKLGDLDVSDVGKAVFGAAAIDRFSQVLHYLKLAKEFVSSDEDQFENVGEQRRTGRDVRFSVTQPLPPKFYIKTAIFSGGDSVSSFDGRMSDMSSNPHRLSQPVLTKIKLDTEKNNWLIDGVFDHRKNKDEDQLVMSAKQADLGKISLGAGKDSGLPQTIIPQQTDLEMKFVIQGDQLNGQLAMVSNKVNFEYSPDAKANTQTKKALRNVFQSFDQVTLDATISGKLSNPNFAVRSNIDKKVSQELNRLLGKKAQAINKKIQNRVNGIVRGELKDVEDGVAKQKQNIEKRLGKRAKKLKVIEDKIAAKQKDIEALIQKKAGKKVDKAKDQLKKKLKF
ncbi:MAG: TIGR03545 family protein [Gammaproteobacteria bacterium]|nr:TIGR03545 family protein [Gammaproteobacteria bacterium]MDH5728713.1 TIGR03545 family protein [Gammaproteobacteria bacterium]